MPKFKNKKELEKYLNSKINLAIKDTTNEMFAHLQENISFYYRDYAPVVYTRTGMLKDSPRFEVFNDGYAFVGTTYIDYSHFRPRYDLVQPEYSVNKNGTLYFKNKHKIPYSELDQGHDIRDILYQLNITHGCSTDRRNNGMFIIPKFHGQKVGSGNSPKGVGYSRAQWWFEYREWSKSNIINILNNKLDEHIYIDIQF